MREQVLRHELLALLEGEAVHSGVKRIVEGIPEECRGKKVRGLPHTLWQLLEHIRLTQADILNYMENPDYEAVDWPEGYWPASAKPGVGEWDKSEKALFRDLAHVKRLVKGAKLFAMVPCGEKRHTLLREILVLACHNTYHLGQMVVLRRLLNTW